jgi:hypothetical protein
LLASNTEKNGVFILGFVTVMAFVVVAYTWHILLRNDSRKSPE